MVDFNPDEIKKEIKKMVSEIAEVPEEEIKDDSRFFDDLGLDSMMALEIVAATEKRFGIVIPEDKIPTLRSVEHVFALITDLKK